MSRVEEGQARSGNFGQVSFFSSLTRWGIVFSYVCCLSVPLLNIGNKMKSLLVTAAITTFVLALFLHSGNGLMCYNCPYTNCSQTITCTGGKDTCIILHHGGKSVSSCWRSSDCNIEFMKDNLSLSNFSFRCCSRDLCNNAPNVVASKIILSGALLLTVVHMLKSLVWN